MKVLVLVLVDIFMNAVMGIILLLAFSLDPPEYPPHPSMRGFDKETGSLVSTCGEHDEERGASRSVSVEYCIEPETDL